MFNEFKRGHRVIVCGYGKNDGKFYKDLPAKIIERDPYYKDYLVKFEDGTQDWILPKYLRQPYDKKRRNKI